MKSFFTVLCFLLTVSSLAAQEKAPTKDPQKEAKALTPTEVQALFETRNTDLSIREAALRTELNARNSKVERQAKTVELKQVEQAMRNNRRILEGKAVQLSQAVKDTN
ncbi:MAG: hypothetical protein AAGM67_05450 [Bacteroidota bacterium]